MLESDIIAVTRRTVASTFESRSYSRSKGKRSRNEQDERSKPEARSSDLCVSRKEEGDPGHRPTENAKLLRPNSNMSKN